MREKRAKVAAPNPSKADERRFLFIWDADSGLQLHSDDKALSVAARAAMVALRPIQKRIREKLEGFVLRVAFGAGQENDTEEDLIATVKRILKAWVTNSAILSSAEEPTLLDLTKFRKSPPELAKSSRPWHAPHVGERKRTDEQSGRGAFADRGVRDAAFQSDARLEHLQSENEQLRRERDHARIDLSKGLSDFALLRQASRIMEVDLTSIQKAIKARRLPTYELAGGRTVIRISEARKLWPHGGYDVPGRPAKRTR